VALSKTTRRLYVLLLDPECYLAQLGASGTQFYRQHEAIPEDLLRAWMQRVFKRYPQPSWIRNSLEELERRGVIKRDTIEYVACCYLLGAKRNG